MADRRLSAVLVSLLLVVSGATAALPSSALTPEADATVFGTAANDSTTQTTTNETTTTGSPNVTDKADPKVSSSLLDRIDSSGPTADGTGAEFVQVVVRARPGRGGEVAGLVGDNGGDVEARHDRLVQARVPESAVRALGASPAVSFVRTPRRPATNDITSEGLSDMDAPAVHDAGYTGENVTVAVIDIGFDVTNPEIADQIVDFRNFSSPDPRTMSNQSGEHGTASAELVADTAPNASIVAVKISSQVELYEAIDWLERNTSTDVVTMSLSWYNAGPLDGTAEMNREINTSVRNGTTWLTSAGNDGNDDHWNGTWSDADADNWMEFSGSDEHLNVTPAGGSGTVDVELSWNDWNGSNEDYDLYLVNDRGTILSYSENVQNGTQPPTESIRKDVSQDVHLKIWNSNANGTSSFDMFFRGDSAPEYSTAARSVTLPATGRNIIAVGAVDHEYDSLEPFSSRGPTIDGRIKPDVVAPDGVTTSTYDSYYGTSAAAPHTAGVVALMLDANSSLSPAAVTSRLEGSADSVQGDEPNNQTGYGLVDADGAVPGVTYSARVNESDGEAASDDEVRMFPLESGKRADGRTSAAGRFSLFARHDADGYVVGYIQGNFSGGDEPYMPRDGSPDVYAVDIVNGTASTESSATTLPGAHVLNVTVVDESGDPVSDATVTVSHFRTEGDTTGYVSYEMLTGADGRISPGGTDGIEIAGDVRVRVDPPSDSTRFAGSNATSVFTVTSDREVTVTLHETVNVSGEVHWADGNKPEYDVVYAKSATAENQSDTINNAGNFTVRGLSPGEPYELGYLQNWSTHPPFARDGAPDVFAFDRVNATDDVDLGRVDLPNPYVLNVSVTDESGDPVENATVSVKHHASGVNATVGVGNVSTDAAGYLNVSETRVRGLEVVGNVTVTVYPPENSSKFPNETRRSVTVTSNRTLEVTLDEHTAAAPDIWDFNLSASGLDTTLTFNSSEQLANVTVVLGGDATGNLTEANFTETQPDPAEPVFVYTANVSADRAGVFNATLLTAEDTDGDDGAAEQFDSVAADISEPSVSLWFADGTNSDGLVGYNHTARIDVDASDDETSVVSVTVDGTDLEAENVTLTDGLPAKDIVYHHYLTVGDVGEGTRNVTVRVTDRAGNTNVTNVSGPVDAIQPHLSRVDLSSTDADRTLAVELAAAEKLRTLRVNLTNNGTTVATFDRSNFTETTNGSGYRYNLTHEVPDDGTYRAVVTNATDRALNGNWTGDSADSTEVDATPPTILNLTADAADGDLAVRLWSDEDLNASSIVATVRENGSTVERIRNFEEFDDAENEYAGSDALPSGVDATWNVTLTRAEDDYGNDGATGQNVSVAVDTRGPKVTQFDASFASGWVTVTLGANESLNASALAVRVTDGNGNAVTTLDSFGPTGDGNYTDSFEVPSGVERNYSVDATRVVDDAGNRANTSASTAVFVDTQVPSVNLSLAATGQRVSVNLTADERLSALDVALAGDASGNVTLSDFDERATDDGYVYTATVSEGSDGWYQATLWKATDEAGNEDDAVSWQRVSITVDTHAPNVTNFSATTADGNLTVEFDSDERLDESATLVTVTNRSGATVARLDEFARDGNHYGTSYPVGSGTDATWNVTLARAEDDFGNDGATGQNDTVVVDTDDPTITEFDVRFDGTAIVATLTADENLSTNRTRIEFVNSSGDATVEAVVDVSHVANHTYEATYVVESTVMGYYTVGPRSVRDTAGNPTDEFGPRDVWVDTAPPKVADATARDEDGTTAVTDGERVTVSVTIANESSSIERAVANASALGGPEAVSLGSDLNGTFTANATGIEDGNYSIPVTVTDAYGNERRVRTNDLTLDTRPPNVSGTALNRTDEILPEDPVAVTVNASDDREVAAVVVDGIALERSDGNWSGPVPAAVELGGHTFRVVVRDRAGNERVVETRRYDVGKEVELNETKNGKLTADAAARNVGSVSIDTENATGDSTENATVEVGTATRNPRETDPEGASLYFPQIDTTIPNDEITNATVTVTVEKSRVREQFVVPETVTFWVEEEGGPGWEEIDGRLVAETDDGYTYEMAVPHFSAFAITGETESAAPNVTAFGPVNDSLAPGEVTISASFDDGYSGVDPANVTLRVDGTDVTDSASVTASGLTYAGDFAEGNYTATLSVTDNASNVRTKTVSFAVANRSDGATGGDGSGGGDGDGSGGGSGSSGGGGANVPPPPVQVTLTDVTDDGFRARVASAREDAPGRISPAGGVGAGDLTLRSLTVVPESEDALPRFFLDVTATTEAPGDADAPAVTTLGYLRVTPTYVTSADLDSVRVRFSVPASATEHPENVALYRLRGGEWHRVETTVAGERGEAYVLTASVDGVGRFAVGVERPDLAVTGAAVGTERADLGETVTVTATVENAGAGTGTRTANLSVGDETVSSQTVTVPAGETKTVEFSVAFDEPGRYDLEVDGTPAGSVVVSGATEETTTENETTTESGATTANATTTATDGLTVQADRDPENGGVGGVPGFGGPAALVALLAGLSVARRRAES